MSPEAPTDLPAAAGRLLLIVGSMIALVGAGLLFFGDRLPRPGRLPGDILIRKPGFTFYFPLGASLLASLALTLIVWLLSLARK